ncbi:hypothetical protein THAOC_01479, partial [Thalassiosira oceanica]
RVDNQRTLQKKGKLPKERVEKLDELGFVWKVRQRRSRSDAGAVGKGEDGSCRQRKRPNTTRGDARTNSAVARSEAMAAEPISNGSASDNTSAASNNEEQPGPNGDANQGDLNSGVRTSSPGDTILDDSNGASESSSTGDMVEAGELNAAGENAPGDGASASKIPLLSNLPELDSEPGSSGLPPFTARKSDASDQEELTEIFSRSFGLPIQSDKIFVADAKADRGEFGSLCLDSTPSSGQNRGDDETVCTTEDRLGEDSQGRSDDADDGSDDTNEYMVGGVGLCWPGLGH